MQLRPWATQALCLCVLMAGPAWSERPEVLLTSNLAEVWGKAPSIDRPRLSPDGSKMLFQTQDPEGLGVALVLDLDSGDLQPVLVGTDDSYDIGWCEWANSDHVVCDLFFIIKDDATDVVQIARGRIRRPPERSSPCGIPQQVGATELTMDWVPDDPIHIVRNCGNMSRQYDLTTGQFEDIAVGFGRDLRGQLMSDGHNFTRVQRHRDTTSGFDRWYFREQVGGDWTLFYETSPFEFTEALRPLGFGANLGLLFHLAAVDGRWGLHVFQLGGELQNAEIFTHPDVDITLVDTMGPYDRVVAAAYLDGRPRRYPVDPRVAGVYEIVSAAYEGQNVEVVDESWDESRYVLLIRPPQHAGNYVLLDTTDASFRPLGAQYDHLIDVELAETETVVFPGADGGMISGHLTLPPDRDGPVGAVIIPRAQPSRLDIADPHYLVQFLAASGYAVLRVNQRGPDEYNGDWLPNRTMFAYQKTAADIDSAMQYLIDEGISEDGRICSAGRDTGAFAAYLNAMEYPGKIACIFTIGGMAAPRAGGDWANVAVSEASILQRDTSPIRRSKDFDTSVLLFHGQYDGVVQMLANSADLGQALDRKDFDVTFIEYEYARHDIERVPYRVDMLTRIGQFLDERIGD